jgi:hypothetical protein
MENLINVGGKKEVKEVKRKKLRDTDKKVVGIILFHFP